MMGGGLSIITKCYWRSPESLFAFFILVIRALVVPVVQAPLCYLLFVNAFEGQDCQIMYTNMH